MEKFYSLKNGKVFKTILFDDKESEILNRVFKDILKKEVKIESLEVCRVNNSKSKKQIIDVNVGINNKEYPNYKIRR